MSSKSNYNSTENKQKRQASSAKKKSYLASPKIKNHVSEDSKSKSGFSFHFAGPKKMEVTTREQNRKNQAKRSRKELRAA